MITSSFIKTTLDKKREKRRKKKKKEEKSMILRKKKKKEEKSMILRKMMSARFFGCQLVIKGQKPHFCGYPRARTVG
jgi:hypothetical protein